MAKIISVFIGLLLSGSLVACTFPVTNLPYPVSKTTPSASEIEERKATQGNPQPQDQATPASSSQPNSPSDSQTQPAFNSTSIEPEVTPTPICDRAAPGYPSIDISIPDETVLLPGQSFSKTWRLENAGACTWTKEYAIVWFSGQTFSGPESARFTSSVKPGQTIDLTIDMIAPEEPGPYQSNWKLRNKDGQLFGIGPNGDAPFWVRILVAPPAPESATPTPMPQPTLAVYVNGLANLRLNDKIDLDANKTNTGENDDLAYKLENNQHELVPENGARLVVFKDSQPTPEDCQSATLSSDPLPVDPIAPGTYLCYRTSLGLPGWARLVFLNPQDSILSLEILTWATP